MSEAQSIRDDVGTARRIAAKRDEWLRCVGVETIHRQRRIVPDDLPPEIQAWIQRLPTALREPGGMLLAGPPGTGKTVAAVAVLSQVFRQCWINELGEDIEPPRPEGLFVRATDLMDAILARERGKAEAMQRARRVRLLVIDDWRAQMPGFVADGLDDLVDRRYCELKPTIVTTNIYAGDRLEDDVENFRRLFPRAASRLLDARGSGLMIVNGDDRRQTGS